MSVSRIPRRVDVGDLHTPRHLVDAGRRTSRAMAAVALVGAVASLLPHVGQLSRRALIVGAAYSATTSMPNHAAAADTPLAVPPSAILLRMVDTTARMEAEMTRAADDMELSLSQRIEAGRPPITREEMNYSINVLLQSSKLDTIPNAGEAADLLRGVNLIAGGGTREITRDEFLSMATQYSRARDVVEKTFYALPEEQQEEGRRVIRKMQAVLDTRKQALAEEQEKLRAARALIANENRQQQQSAEPRRQKTLAELEAAQAGFGKQPQPVMSLYANPGSKMNYDLYR